MIKQVYTYGKPKNRRTEIEVSRELSFIENEDTEYVIGIDYSREDSNDYTAVAKLKDNEDGTYTLVGTELIK